MRIDTGQLGLAAGLIGVALLNYFDPFGPEYQVPVYVYAILVAVATLFGAWEGNWVAFNDAHDVKLPGSNEPAIAFLMYPQAENKGGFLDSLDPDKFKYRITARELTA